MITEFTRFRCTSPSSSATSKWRDPRVTTHPPRFIAMKLENWPVPCINGHAESSTKPGCAGSSRLTSSSTDVAGGTPSTALPPLPSTLNRSSWRHITPLGMPVVPPVYSSSRSSPLRPHGPCTGPCTVADTTVS